MPAVNEEAALVAECGGSQTRLRTWLAVYQNPVFQSGRHVVENKPTPRIFCRTFLVKVSRGSRGL